MRLSPTKAWFVWFLVSFFYFYQYIIRVLPNILMPEIMAKFHIEADIFGQFTGSYYLGYIAMHIPLGIMLDRFGLRKVLPISILVTMSGLLPLVYADTWIYPCIGRLIVGCGSSAAILGVFKIIRTLFPENRFSTMLGFSVAIGLVGAIYGGEPVNFLMKTFGWELIIKFMILGGVLFAILTYIFLPNTRADKSETGVWGDVKQIFTHPMYLSVCLLGGLMVGPLEGFADAWGTEFLKSVHGYTTDVASTLPSLVFFGMMFGSPVLSYLTARLNSYFETIILSAFTMAGAFFYLMYSSGNVSIFSAVLFVVGIFCSYQILVIYKASFYLPERLLGLTTACANMIIMAFGSFFHPTIGKIIQLSWDGQVKAGIPFYNAEVFVKGVMVIPICLIIAGVGFLILRLRSE